MPNIKTLYPLIVAGKIFTEKDSRIQRAGTGFVAERLDWRGKWVILGLSFEPRQSESALKRCLETIREWQKLPF